MQNSNGFAEGKAAADAFVSEFSSLGNAAASGANGVGTVKLYKI